jgi:hypothetical protein
MHEELLFSWEQKNNYECMLSDVKKGTARRIQFAITCLPGLEQIGLLS